MKGRSSDKRGRSKKGPPFVQVLHWVMDSAPWLALPAVEKAAYVQLSRRFNGSNNGRLALSARVLADELHIGKATAARALNALVESGLVQCVKDCGFNMKSERLSREYRLVCYRCDVTGQLPINSFHGLTTGTARSHHRDTREDNPIKTPTTVSPQVQIGGVS